MLHKRACNLVAVSQQRAGQEIFCHEMGSGPVARAIGEKRMLETDFGAAFLEVCAWLGLLRGQHNRPVANMTTVPDANGVPAF